MQLSSGVAILSASGVAYFIDSEIKIFPCSFNLNIDLRDARPIKPPAILNPFLVLAKRFSMRGE
jgi:hypothetical protein